MNTEREAFRAYLVSNDGNSGALVRFPTTPETYAEALRFIGLDTDESSHWSSFYCPEQPLIGDMIPMDAHVDELNYLAVRFLALDNMNRDKYLSILERANPTMQPLPVAELINHAENLNAYHYIHGIENDQELGTEILNYEVDGLWDALEKLSESTRAPQRIIANFLYESIHRLDAERIGKEIRERENGGYGSGGYLAQISEPKSSYRECADIPPSYRIAEVAALIMAEPEPRRSVRSQLKDAKEQMEVAPKAKPLGRKTEQERVM